MKNMTLPMFVLACCLGVSAQSFTSGDSMKHDKMAGKKTSISGCISEKDGKYLLSNDKHPDGVELSTSEDLKPHVGQKVRVTGILADAMAGSDKMGSGDAMAHDKMAAGDKMASGDSMAHDKMAMGHGSMMALNVSKLEMKSTTCDISAMKK